MKNRRFAKILIVLAVVLSMTFSVTAAESTAGETEYKEITFQYTDGASKTTQHSGFIYYDELLMADANNLSKELAKVSAGLAVAAYEQGTINSVLGQMGYTCNDNSAAYSQVNNFTITNNDHVAYTIATNEVTYNGEPYLIYCVPVKGTGENAEWFSNFKIGTDDTHEGFKNAASEVRADLFDLFAEDGYNADHRILWFTGHSRGAAVANLLAGWFTTSQDYAKSEHIFGYTYACPAVSKTAIITNNIYNFNNAGDLVTMMPYESWGYYRYGNDISLDGADAESTVLIDNLRNMYPLLIGKEYTSATTGDNWQEILNAIVENEDDLSEPKVKLCLNLLAYSMGGHNQATMPEVLAYVGYESVDDICSAINDFTMDKLYEEIVNKSVEYLDLLDFLKECFSEDMTDEEWAVFLEEYSEQVNKIEEIVGEAIESVADMNAAMKVLNELYSFASTMNDIDEDFMMLFYDASGTYNLLDKVKVGHTQATYLMWLNAQYYGYRGWYYNTDQLAVNLGDDDGIYTIGAQCFAECSNIAWAKIDQIGYLGELAFDGCYGMKEITLPVDYRIEGNPFRRCTGVNEIHYTYGKTGIMPDRSDDKDFTNYYDYTLESACIGSLKSIDFEEGITKIGNYAYYNSSGLVTGVLESVTLPDTLESIGEGAFYEQTMLQELVLPESVTSLGAKCFMQNTSLKSINLPEGLTEIPEYCFYCCSSLENIVIPDSVESLGQASFQECSSLVEITLPVDYDFSNVPFMATTGVKTIHYTYGKTGVMPDRSDDADLSNCYSNTLEYYSINSLTSIDFEEGITRIGNYAYYNYSGLFSGVLKSVTFPESLESIGDGAFFDQSAIGDVVLPDSVTSIGKQCFMNSTGLTSIQLPEGLTAIPEYSFYCCTSLESIVIPDSVTSLGQASFQDCDSLVEVTLPVDYDNSKTPFISTTSVQKINYTYGKTGKMPDRNKSYSSDAYYYTKCLEYYSRANLKEVNFEEGITAIGNYAFYNGLNYNVKLTAINLPSTLTTIGKSAFYCQKALEEIVIPVSVKTVGEYAFYTCSSLTDAYYCGTEAMWVAVSVGNFNTPLTSALTYHKWDEGAVTKPATTKEEGVFTYTCTFCGGTKEEAIEMLISVAEIFSDVNEGSWYINAVQYVYDNGIMSGSNGAFNPTGNVTRAQVVSTLYKLAGSPEVTDYTACEELIDVQKDMWYTDAVCWAYNTGVGSGNLTTKMFNMSTPVTRQQLASFFYNYAKYAGRDVTTLADISSMVNADKVASYAETAVRWAVGAGIISGSAKTDESGNTAYDLKPTDTATRAQLAAILQKFCESNF